MKVSILVGTYGSAEWEAHGQEKAALCYPFHAHQATAFHTSDGTLAQARNTLGRMATGDWLLFLDADDDLSHDYLQAMYAARCKLQRAQLCQECEPESALLVPAVSYIRDGLPVGKPSIPRWGAPLEEVNCAVIGTLIARSVFLAVGGFREWPMYEDWDLWLRAVRYGCSLVPVPHAVYRATVSGTGASSGRNHEADRDARSRRETYLAIRRDLGIAP